MSKKKDEEKEKPAFQKLYERDKAKETADVAEQLSIKTRLLNRLKFRTVPVPFEDADGKFTIEIRLLSPAEQNGLLRIQQKLSEVTKKITTSKTAKEQEAIRKTIDKLNDQTCALLGNICVDPELDKEFWKLGEGYNVDVPQKLLTEATRLSLSSEDEIRFLREEPKGKGSSNS